MLICSTLHIIDKVVIILTHHYGYLLKVLSGCMKASMDNALASMDLTSAQGHIMGYLAQRSQPPCSRDIEETFHMSHPTVSGLLSRLEKKDFIELRPDETDRRCKRIYVLPKGDELHETTGSFSTTKLRWWQAFPRRNGSCSLPCSCAPSTTWAQAPVSVKSRRNLIHDKKTRPVHPGI